MWIPKPRELSPPDTIPLHPQTAGRNPDIMLIARSKSKSLHNRGIATGMAGTTIPPAVSRYVAIVYSTGG
jgi:hypothetical protein